MASEPTDDLEELDADLLDASESESDAVTRCASEEAHIVAPIPAPIPAPLPRTVARGWPRWVKLSLLVEAVALVLGVVMAGWLLSRAAR